MSREPLTRLPLQVPLWVGWVPGSRGAGSLLGWPSDDSPYFLAGVWVVDDGFGVQAVFVELAEFDPSEFEGLASATGSFPGE